MKKYSNISLFVLLIITSYSVRADTPNDNTYWIQLFAATDKQSINRFISKNPKFSWNNVITEHNLHKVIVGPFARLSLAKIGLSELDSFKDAFIKSYDSTTRLEYNEKLTKLIQSAQNRTHFQLNRLNR